MLPSADRSHGSSIKLPNYIDPLVFVGTVLIIERGLRMAVVCCGYLIQMMMNHQAKSICQKRQHFPLPYHFLLPSATISKAAIFIMRRIFTFRLLNLFKIVQRLMRQIRRLSVLLNLNRKEFSSNRATILFGQSSAFRSCHAERDE